MMENKLKRPVWLDGNSRLKKKPGKGCGISPGPGDDKI